MGLFVFSGMIKKFKNLIIKVSQTFGLGGGLDSGTFGGTFFGGGGGDFLTYIYK